MGRNQPSVDEATAGSPVELEVTTLGARNGVASQSESFVGSLSSRELNEAVTSVTICVSFRILR